MAILFHIILSRDETTATQCTQVSFLLLFHIKILRRDHTTATLRRLSTRIITFFIMIYTYFMAINIPFEHKLAYRRAT